MKEVLIALWLGILSLFGMTPEATMLGGGPGTINQLEQWKSTSTPSAITQNVYGKPILITGLNDGCVELVSGFATTTTGLPCGSGGGGGGSATTTINGVEGPTFTFTSANAAFTYSTTTGTVTLNLATTSLASQLSVSLASTTNWNGFYDTPSSRITAGDALTWSGNTLNFDGGNAPGGELGGTWASTSIDDGLAVTNWNLTTPTLTSFFGTPCTGNDFLQDISDTGAFTCATAAGGGSDATTTLSGNSQIALSNPIAVFGSSPSVLSIVADSIGDTQLAFNTGQDLTTASSPTFSALTVTNAINVGTNIVRSGDSDTYIEFLNDSQRFYGGGIQLLRLAEAATDAVSINPDVNDVDFAVNWDSGTTIFADGANGAITFGTLTGTANNCLQVNSSGVLSGTGAPCGGSGGGGLATSSPWTDGNLAYVTGAGTVGSVATGTLTENVSGLEFDATRALVGGSATLSLSSGFIIPLSASTTNWNTFYDTPSNRITAGNGLAWTGNTLSATSTHAAVTLAGEDYLSLSTQQITANAIDPDNLSSSDFGSFTCNGTTCTVDSGAISNAMLANSTVSYGGVSLSLGGTDATPAFNLADATGLPISTGVSGLGSNVATFLATPSSANLRSALTDEVGTGPAVFASSTMLTSPTLVSFFGTACTGNEFLQDISDTGVFTCAEAAGGGGGGGSLSTSTDIIGAPGTVEDLSYVGEDFLIGGNSSTTAEFQFDPDGGQFFIASTTNGNATATVESNNNAQAVRLGDDIGSGIEWVFSTVGDAILDTYGAVTRLVVSIAETLFQGNVRITGTLHVATTTYNNATTSDALTIDGFTNSGEWMQEFCTSPTAEVTQVVADVLRGCNRFTYIEDAAGALDYVMPTTGTSTYFNIRPGAVGSVNAAGDGMGIGWASGLDFGDIQRHSPAMEWAMRQDSVNNATSTFAFAGITSAVTVGANFAAAPAQGFFVIASSTDANWQFACKPSTGTAYFIDTGIASSTTATASANPFVHFRIEVSGTSNTAVTAILKARTTSNRDMTHIASCTINTSASTQAVAPTVAIGKSTAGSSPALHAMFIKFWYKQPVF